VFVIGYCANADAGVVDNQHEKCRPFADARAQAAALQEPTDICTRETGGVWGFKLETKATACKDKGLD
jgi:hypothetical protein